MIASFNYISFSGFFYSLQFCARLLLAAESAVCFAERIDCFHFYYYSNNSSSSSNNNNNNYYYCYYKVNTTAAVCARNNLHIVLCMSPVGNAFRSRCRMFPSLVNCCTIDWFIEWPREALLSVSKTAFEPVDFGQDELRVGGDLFIYLFIDYLFIYYLCQVNV